MSRTRRLLRLYLMMLAIILLPLGGFLWSVPGYHLHVVLIGAACFALVVLAESITLLTEREAMTLKLKANQEAEDLAQWKEKVRELERIVGIISRENDDLRREELTRSFHGAKPESAGAA